jgi:hypothetical protein
MKPQNGTSAACSARITTTAALPVTRMPVPQKPGFISFSFQFPAGSGILKNNKTVFSLNSLHFTIFRMYFR